MRNLSQSLRYQAIHLPYRLFLFVIILALFAGCATPPRSTSPAPAGKSKAEKAITTPQPAQQQGLTGPEPLVETIILPPPAKVEILPEPESVEVDTSALEEMANTGRFLDAALAYVKLAAGFPPPLRERYTLRAAELLMTGNYVPQSYQLLQDTSDASMPPELEIRRLILRARIALARNQPQQALSELGAETFFLSDGHPEHLINIHELRAGAYLQLEDYLETVRERVELEALLSTPAAIEKNQQAILESLRQLAPETVQLLLSEKPGNHFNGWLELAAIDQADQNIRFSRESLNHWRQRYPRHPASRRILDAILAARPPVTPLPEQIALILPLNNRFAKAATAVQDGFLAAYYAHLTALGPEPQNGAFIPRIKTYSEGANPALVRSVITQAVNDGARFIIGPLNKEAVNQLAQSDDLPVPILALNFSEDVDKPDEPDKDSVPLNFYQMSLSPEYEARQVAERAWLDGHTRAAIIRPDSAWGGRVSEAFARRWEELGGKVVNTRQFETKKSDYSLPIRELLNVAASEQRNRALRRELGIKLEFIPRRRQDIDFIFMVASSRQARLIPPQLRFHHAINLPVYATSHSFSGSINADMDRDMNGVLFSDIPWTLRQRPATQEIKHQIEQTWPGEAKLYSRLYALGVDAYNLIGKLDELDRDPAAFFPGETGDLYLDVNNRLQRRLTWAKFQSGIPRIIDDF